jgi:catechol-2,3-dioxygenase
MTDLRAPSLRTAGMLTSGFAELTLEVRDRERVERFYVEALGLEVLAREDDRTWLAAGRHARLGLWLPGEKEFGDQGGAHVHFAFSAAPGRLDAVRERLQHAGVEHRGPVEHPGGDRSIYVEDPEGNVVEVWDFFHRDSGRREGADALADEDSAADPSH